MFDCLDPTYETSKARIRSVEKDLAVLSAFIMPIEKATEERSHERFFFHTPKTRFFQKQSKLARQTLFFQKMTKIFYLKWWTFSTSFMNLK